MAQNRIFLRLLAALVVSLVCGTVNATGDFLAWAEYDA